MCMYPGKTSLFGHGPPRKLREQHVRDVNYEINNKTPRACVPASIPSDITMTQIMMTRTAVRLFVKKGIGRASAQIINNTKKNRKNPPEKNKKYVYVEVVCIFSECCK